MANKLFEQSSVCMRMCIAFFVLLHLFIHCIQIEFSVYDSLGTQHHIAIG